MKLKMSRRRIFGLFVLVLIGNCAFAAPACTALQADQIFATDLVQASAAFGNLDPKLVMVPAPYVGATRVMRPFELAGLVRKHGVSLPDEAVLRAVCFTRQSEPLTEEILRPVILRALQTDAQDHAEGDFAITDFSHIQIPVGSEPRVELIRSALTSAGFWRGRLIYGTDRSVPLWVKIRLQSGATGNSFSRPDGRKPDEMVERGDRVQVEVRSGAARLGFEASAESAGRLGDSILVKNPQNGRLFQAKVENKRRVIVER